MQGVFNCRLEEELSDLKTKSVKDLEQLQRDMSGHVDDVRKLRQCEEQLKRDVLQRKQDVERLVAVEC